MKLPVPISGPELTVMIFLLADWRCWQYQLKRQNDTEIVNPPFIVLSLIKNIKEEAHLNLYSRLYVYQCHCPAVRDAWLSVESS